MSDNSLIHFVNIDIYRRDEPVFRNLNFHLRKGEMMYISGPTSFASSLLLSGFYAHAELSGEKANVLGFDLLNISRAEVTALRQKIGLVLNENFLYEEYSLEENLRKFSDIMSEFSSINRDQDTSAWLGKFGLDPAAKASDLDVNDRTLYSVAKALFHQPDILFVEDHFGSLEIEDQMRIMDTLIDYVRKELCSVVMIQSNSDFIERYPGMIYTCRESDPKAV